MELSVRIFCEFIPEFSEIFFSKCCFYSLVFLLCIVFVVLEDQIFSYFPAGDVFPETTVAFFSECGTEATTVRRCTASGGAAHWHSWGSSYRTWAAETERDKEGVSGTNKRQEKQMRDMIDK
jgi:hypothetical protein